MSGADNVMTFDTVSPTANASARILNRAKAGLDAAGLGVEGIPFVQADILKWTPPSREFDLVATHFVLDCFRSEQLERLVGRLAEVVMPEARWLLSDFCRPPSGLAKWRARLILEAMYLFFGWTTGLPAERLTCQTQRWCGGVLSFDNGICPKGDSCTLICGNGDKLTISTWAMGFRPVLRGPLFHRQQGRNPAQGHRLSVLD
jgi:hypothetical protein